jgi:hypothetical protein
MEFVTSRHLQSLIEPRKIPLLYEFAEGERALCPVPAISIDRIEERSDLAFQLSAQSRFV